MGGGSDSGAQSCNFGHDLESLALRGTSSDCTPMLFLTLASPTHAAVLSVHMNLGMLWGGGGSEGTARMEKNA